MNNYILGLVIIVSTALIASAMIYTPMKVLKQSIWTVLVNCVMTLFFGGVAVFSGVVCWLTSAYVISTYPSSSLIMAIVIDALIIIMTVIAGVIIVKCILGIAKIWTDDKFRDKITRLE